MEVVSDLMNQGPHHYSMLFGFICDKISEIYIMKSGQKMRAGYPLPNIVDSWPYKESRVDVEVAMSSQVKYYIMPNFRGEETSCVEPSVAGVGGGGVLRVLKSYVHEQKLLELGGSHVIDIFFIILECYYYYPLSASGEILNQT